MREDDYVCRHHYYMLPERHRLKLHFPKDEGEVTFCLQLIDEEDTRRATA